MLAVPLSWAMAVDLTPAGQLPRVGSTTTNAGIDLAIGSNGPQRLLGRGGSVGDQPRQVAPATGATGAQGTRSSAKLGSR